MKDLLIDAFLMIGMTIIFILMVLPSCSSSDMARNYSKYNDSLPTYHIIHYGNDGKTIIKEYTVKCGISCIYWGGSYIKWRENGNGKLKVITGTCSLEEL